MRRRQAAYFPRERNRRSLVLLALALILGGLAVTGGEILALGSLSTTTIAVNGLVGTLLPFVVITLLAVQRTPAGGAGVTLGSLGLGWDPEGGMDEGDDDGGGGDGRGPGDDPRPLPPSGGLGWDWDAFESAFRDYARERELLV